MVPNAIRGPRLCLILGDQLCHDLSSLQQGWGMIQVDKAWEYLNEYRNDIYEDVSCHSCSDQRY